jgi:hypothetical protein
MRRDDIAGGSTISWRNVDICNPAAPIDEQVTDNHRSKTARNAGVCVVMNGCQVAP